MRRIIFVAVLLCSLLLSNIAMAAPAQIAVAIELDKLAVQLRGQSSYQVVDSNNNVVYVSKDKHNGFLNIKENELYINNEKLPNKVRLVPLADNFIEINRRTYRGTFNVRKTSDNTIEVINILPIEDYVAGTLSKEIELGFNEQVLKAQAVAIRSQAYFLAAVGNAGYDTVANDMEHGGLVYLGKDAESKEAIKAVQETAGEIMLYKGRPVFAMWHVSSGGYTEYGSEFFDMKLPYLQMVKDFDDKSQFYSWKEDFTPADLDIAFERAGYRLGKIQTIKLSRMPKNRPTQSPVADRSPAGRLKEITVIGEQGQVITLAAQEFVSIVGLNSNLFDVAIGTPLPKDIIATVTDPMGNEHELDRIEVNISEREGYRLPGDDDNIRRISRVKDDKVVFYGYGTGRGFGLSQQGAQAMAMQDLQKQTDALKAEQEKQKKAKSESKANKSDQSKPQAKDTKSDIGKAPSQASAEQAEKQAAQDKSEKPNVETNNKKKEEVKLASDYYRKILNYYFTSVTIEKVY